MSLMSRSSYEERRIELVLNALTAAPQTFQEICEKVGAKGSIFDEGGFPITRGEVMLALKALVLLGMALKDPFSDTTVSSYRLQEREA